MNKNEVLERMKIEYKTDTYIKDFKFPEKLERHLRQYIEDTIQTPHSFAKSYSTRIAITEQNWAELEQVLSVYFSPLNKALS